MDKGKIVACVALGIAAALLAWDSGRIAENMCSAQYDRLWARYMACVEGTCGPDVTCVEQECQQILDDEVSPLCEE